MIEECGEKCEGCEATVMGGSLQSRQDSLCCLLTRPVSGELHLHFVAAVALGNKTTKDGRKSQTTVH